MSARRLIPRATHLFGLALVALCGAAWLATGRETFTRWPNARLEASDAPVSESEANLLGEIGIDSPAAPGAPAIESRFALGILPSGGDPAHLMSVATALVAALFLSASVVLFNRSRLPKES
jgi:hypothetical protein